MVFPVVAPNGNTIVARKRRTSMRTWKRVAAILSVCLITGAFGQQVQRSTVLPMSEAKAVATRFPKRGPNRISGAWELTKADIDSLEVDLSQISGLPKKNKAPWMQIDHPENYFRQYVGVLQAGQKRVYVSAFCQFMDGDSPTSPEWKNHVLLVSDGGNCFWQALYDPSSRRFLELWVNGRA